MIPGELYGCLLDYFNKLYNKFKTTAQLNYAIVRETLKSV